VWIRLVGVRSIPALVLSAATTPIPQHVADRAAIEVPPLSEKAVVGIVEPDAVESPIVDYLDSAARVCVGRVMVCNLSDLVVLDSVESWSCRHGESWDAIVVSALEDEFLQFALAGGIQEKIWEVAAQGVSNDQFGWNEVGLHRA
jgi:hypothetical protein